MNQKRTVGLVIRDGLKEALPLAKRVVEFCLGQEILVVSTEESARELLGFGIEILPPQLLTLRADPIVTLGGDGTLIGVARHARDRSPILIGVNFGTLGFLTEIAPEECLETLTAVLNGAAKVGRREMAQAEVFREGKRLFSCQAVNEALVQKGTEDRLLTLEITADYQPVMQLKGDGVMVATPTGSTAYSLAAGGSIVHPDLSALLLSPVCPHSLTARPLILPSSVNISISIPSSYDGKVVLLVDGQESFPLSAGDEVRVNRAPNAVHFVHSQTKSYFDILRTKLRWGLRNMDSGLSGNIE